MKRPPALQANDKAIILSPAGRIEATYVEKAITILKQWRLDANISENALCHFGRFSGFVEQRLHDLQAAFDDEQVKMILCSRGGYGAVHLLDKIDFTGIKKSPKWLIGYSDITALHAALQTQGIMSVHGPMTKHFAEEGGDDPAVLYTKTILAGQSIQYQLPVAKNGFLNREGKATGQLFGGNLTVFCGLLGTSVLTIPRGGILFIEDIGEEPYKVDRMLHQLKLAGVFKKIKGLIVGQFTDYEEDQSMYGALHECIYKTVSEYDFPICFDFPVGHVTLNFPLIMGARATLHVKKNQVIFKQH